MLQSKLKHTDTAPVRRTTLSRLATVLICFLLIGGAEPVFAERVKDIASIAGVRDNPLLGYGLVVGLDGTGDQTNQVSFTEQSLRSLLVQNGVTIPPNITLQPKNVAAAVSYTHLTLPTILLV